MKLFKILLAVVAMLMVWTDFLQLALANNVRKADKELIYLATKADFESESTQNWIKLLNTMITGLPYKHIQPSEVTQFKKQKFIIVSGAVTEPGIDEIIKNLLSSEEMDSASKAGGNGFYIKKNVWGEDQTIIVFTGSDLSAVWKAREDSRMKWENLIKEAF
jgi:hypothetical protein